MSVMTQKQIAEMNTITWWRRMNLGTDEEGRPVITPGLVDHGPVGGDWPSTRFGLPDDLTGKIVLDKGRTEELQKLCQTTRQRAD